MTHLAIPVSLRWSDIDAYGHVNNAAWLSLLEEARIQAFWDDPAGERAFSTAILPGGPSANTHTVVAHQEIEYLLPLRYQRAPVLVQLWVARLGGASLDINYEVEAEKDLGRQVAMRARTTLVLVNAATGSPRRLTQMERETWSEYLDHPVSLGRRTQPPIYRTQVPGV